MGYEVSAGGYYSAALGYSAYVSGSCSIALGYYAKTSGANSVALGYGAEANGSGSIALGRSAETSGVGTSALGLSANASGDHSIALGYYAKASGNNSAALGTNASASGNYSIALGYESRASGNNSTALGYGAETSSERATALGCGAKVASFSPKTMQLGDATNLSSLKCRVALDVTSDERDKADIAPITDGLAFVSALEPIQYVYNHRDLYINEEESLTEKDLENKRRYGMCEYDRKAHALGQKKGRRKRVGLSAQQIQEALTSVYGTADYANIVNDNFHDMDSPPSDVENQLSATYESFIPFLILAVKELNEKVEKLEVQLNER